MPFERTGTPKSPGLADPKEGYMSFVPTIRTILVSVLAAAFGLLLTNFLASSVTTPRAVLAGEATVSPFAMMKKAPLNLPVEQYDSY